MENSRSLEVSNYNNMKWSNYEISPLLKVPIQNRNPLLILKDSSISSFLDYSIQLQKLDEEKKKKNLAHQSKKKS